MAEVFSISRLGILVVSPVRSHAYLHLLYANMKRRGLLIYDRNHSLDVFKTFALRDRISIVHFHWIEYFFRRSHLFSTITMGLTFILLLTFLKNMLRLRIVITLHNVVPHERVFPKLEHVFFRMALTLSDKIIVHNKYSKRLTQKLYKVEPSKLFVIPHGNFISYYPNDISPEEARTKLGLCRDDFVLLLLGSMREYKDVPFLLQAFEEAFKRRSNLFLLVAGECSNNDLRQQLASFRKCFPTRSFIIQKYVKDTDVQIFMNAADVGVLPYKAVSTPGSLLLFASFSKPVIVPAKQPILEIANSDFCMFYDQKLKNSLVDAITKAEMERTLLSDMGKKAFEAASFLSWEVISSTVANLYFECIQSKNLKSQD